MINVAVADRNAILGIGIEMVLSQIPNVHSSGLVATWKELMQLCLAKTPDIILLDYTFESELTKLLIQLRKFFSLSQIIILCDYPSDEQILDAIMIGIGGCVTKSSSLESLELAIRSVFNKATWMDSCIAEALISNRKRGISQETIKHVASSFLLSAREREVLELLCTGLSNSKIAKLLYLSPETVKSHVSHIFQKLNVNSRSQAVIAAVRNGLISLMSGEQADNYKDPGDECSNLVATSV